MPPPYRSRSSSPAARLPGLRDPNLAMYQLWAAAMFVSLLRLSRWRKALSAWKESLFLIRCKPAVVVKAKG